jgi:cation-transporting ATPase 13A2
MVIYSFTQFLSMCILYTASTNLSDGQFLYTDLFLISHFALFFGHTGPGQALVPNPPPFSLISLRPMLSIVLQTLNIFGFQIAAFLLVKEQDWFIPKESSEDTQDVIGYENYSVFAVSVFQYIVMVFVYSQVIMFKLK